MSIFVFLPRQSIRQMMFKPCMEVEWEPVREIDHTRRGDNSFGGSGLEAVGAKKAGN